MNCKLDHVAITSNKVDELIDLFSYVFNSQVTKEVKDEEGIKQCWLSIGLQINRISEEAKPSPFFDHIALQVSDVDDCIKRSYDRGAISLEKGKNWILYPFGLCIELLPWEE